MQADADRSREYVEKSVGIITALYPHLGYEVVARIARRRSSKIGHRPAGGIQAIFEAVEDAEDNEAAGRDAVYGQRRAGDVLVGIAASGKTPYVLGAVLEAKRIGALTIGLSCNAGTLLSKVSPYAIEVSVGPEVVTGSTRLKTATAQKWVLNMISTTVMIRLGKVYKNLMVNVQASNDKLRERVVGSIMEAAGLTRKLHGFTTGLRTVMRGQRS